MRAVLPVFPLTGALLLPGTRLPLNVFEPRYRNLVADVQEGDGLIGIIQPREPQADNAGPAPGAAPEPPLYAIGCAGKLEHCERLDDGRFRIRLRGLQRFQGAHELPRCRGYRRLEVSFEPFAVDLEPEPSLDADPQPILDILTFFAGRFQLPIDLEWLGRLPTLALVNTLAMALPFSPAERQALLEAPDPAARLKVLSSLIAMAVMVPAGDGRGGDAETH